MTFSDLALLSRLPVVVGILSKLSFSVYQCPQSEDASTVYEVALSSWANSKFSCTLINSIELCIPLSLFCKTSVELCMFLSLNLHMTLRILLPFESQLRLCLIDGSLFHSWIHLHLADFEQLSWPAFMHPLEKQHLLDAQCFATMMEGLTSRKDKFRAWIGFWRF
jgi:hypothetical protein